MSSYIKPYIHHPDEMRLDLVEPDRLIAINTTHMDRPYRSIMRVIQSGMQPAVDISVWENHRVRGEAMRLVGSCPARAPISFEKDDHDIIQGLIIPDRALVISRLENHDRFIRMIGKIVKAELMRF